MSIFCKPHSQVFPLFVYRGLQVKVVVCFLLLGAGRAVNVLVPYMYKIIGEFHYYFVWMILFWVKFGASYREVYKFVAHAALASHVDHTVRQKLETQIFLEISWVSAVDVIQLWPQVTVWSSGQGSIFTDSKFGESKFESRQSHSFKIWNFFLVFWSLFSPLLVSLYYSCWSFKASQGFCGNVFPVYF